MPPLELKTKYDDDTYLRDPRTGETGIFVRAKRPSGKYDSVDIAELDRESLIRWLADDHMLESVFCGRCAISTCLHLLGHPMLDKDETLPL